MKCLVDDCLRRRLARAGEGWERTGEGGQAGRGPARAGITRIRRTVLGSSRGPCYQRDLPTSKLVVC